MNGKMNEATYRSIRKSDCNLTLVPPLNKVVKDFKKLSENIVSARLNRASSRASKWDELYESRCREMTRRSEWRTLQYSDALPRGGGFIVRLRRQHVCDSGRRDDVAGPGLSRLRRSRLRISRLRRLSRLRVSRHRGRGYGYSGYGYGYVGPRCWFNRAGYRVCR